MTAGRTFVSTQTVPSTGWHIHCGNEITVGFNYGRLLKTHKTFGLYAELPVAIYPRMDVNYHFGTTPKDSGSLLGPPSLRVNIFSAPSRTPSFPPGPGHAPSLPTPRTLYPTPHPT